MITARSEYFRTFRDLQLHIIGAVESNSYFSYKATDYMEEHTVIWYGLALMQCFLACGWGPNMDHRSVCGSPNESCVSGFRYLCSLVEVQ